MVFAQTEFRVCVCVQQREHKNISAKSANPKADKNTSLIFFCHTLFHIPLKKKNHNPKTALHN